MSLGRWWDVQAGGLVLAGLMQLPGDMALSQLAGPGASAGLTAVAAFVDLVPALPLALALAGLAGGRIPWGLALGLTLVSALPAAVLTLLASYDTGGGAEIILAEGLALSLAVWGMLWCLAGQGVPGRALHGLAVLAALCSLATPFAVARQARLLADGAAFCIARHEADRPIRSWAELRGASFHTNRSGYKDTSSWYLHGLLLVDRVQGIEVWNWSPRHLRFDPLPRAGQLVVSPFRTCTPVPAFLGRLSLF